MEPILERWASSPPRLRINMSLWPSCITIKVPYWLCWGLNSVSVFFCELEPDSSNHSFCQGRWQWWGGVTMVLHLQRRCHFALPWLRWGPLLPALFSVSLTIPLGLRGGSQVSSAAFVCCSCWAAKRTEEGKIWGTLIWTECCIM